MRNDDWNYLNDPRTQGPAPERIVVTIMDEEVELPTKYVVCHLCKGEGKHVNPAIDCNGLTAEDFRDDPEFLHDYMAGAYDVPCNSCRGKRVVKEPDWDQLTPEQRAAWREEQQAEAEYRAECAMERRYGC